MVPFTAVLQPATLVQRGDVLGLLRQAHLPVADLEAGGHADFIVALDDDHVIGAVGVEVYDTVALLRSLAVRAAWQGRGIGEALLQAAEDGARTRGVTALWLLTTDASEYFTQRGFVAQSRAAAPDSLLGCAQFKLLCPSSAACLSKTLD